MLQGVRGIDLRVQFNQPIPEDRSRVGEVTRKSLRTNLWDLVRYFLRAGINGIHPARKNLVSAGRHSCHGTNTVRALNGGRAQNTACGLQVYLSDVTIS